MLQNLIDFIKRHGNEVVRASERSITVVGTVCFEGVAYEVPQTIPATWDDVRDWLGY